MEFKFHLLLFIIIVWVKNTILDLKGSIRIHEFCVFILFLILKYLMSLCISISIYVFFMNDFDVYVLLEVIVPPDVMGLRINC